MARLFITERELALYSDIVKEVVKDISGQAIYYYPVNYEKTNPDNVYQESVEKIFDRPLYIQTVVEYQGQTKNTMNASGTDKTHTLIVHLHRQDMIDKGITPKEGDFVQFGDVNYEIQLVVQPDIQFGMQSQSYWYKLTCEQSDAQVFYRETQPELNLQSGREPEHFTQTRGEADADLRRLQAPDKVGKPLTGAKSSPFDVVNGDD